MEFILQEIEASEEGLILRRVDLSNITMREIRADLLKYVTRLQEFTTNSEARLSTDQLRTIFTEIVEREDIQLRVLKVPGNKLVGLKPHLVAAAVEKLVSLDLEATHITDTNLALEIFRKERAHLMFIWGPNNVLKQNCQAVFPKMT